ncbi:MAG: isoprenylcysteine carboxylmethyltransferase family protein [Planctomycetes bacterium]|nr:isoprenylcysteine carboxylmethyltransferase family protein [Planctomycetota bacterium]
MSDNSNAQSNVAAAFAQGPVVATKRPEIPDGKRREKRLDLLRLQGFWPLNLAFVFLALRSPLAEEHPALMAIRFTGLGLMVLGLLMRIWSLGYLRKRAELATAGPYGRTRNPLYVGTWLIGCGLALNAAFPFNLGLIVLYNVMFFFIYRAQIAIEEEMLRDIFGPIYDEYLRNVPKFFPQLKAWTVGDVSRFSLSRAFKNRAWELVLGLAIMLALQVASWGILWPMIRGATIAEAWAGFLAGGWLK